MNAAIADIGRFLGALVVGYLFGSVPSGVLVGKLFGDKDPRAVGSGKTGATNILRTVGPGAALIVACTDMAKGAIPVLLARYVIFPGQPWAEVVAGRRRMLFLYSHRRDPLCVAGLDSGGCQHSGRGRGARSDRARQLCASGLFRHIKRSGHLFPPG